MRLSLPHLPHRFPARWQPSPPGDARLTPAASGIRQTSPASDGDRVFFGSQSQDEAQALPDPSRLVGEAHKVAVLSRNLTSDEPNVRHHAAKRIKDIKTGTEIARLIRLALKQDDRVTRVIAFKNIAKITDRTIRHALAELGLVDDSALVRARACQELHTMPNTPVKRALIQHALQDTDPDVRKTAIPTILSLPDNHIPLIKIALQDAEKENLAKVGLLLRRLPNSDEKQSLVQDALKHPALSVQLHAVEAISGLDRDQNKRAAIDIALASDSDWVQVNAFGAIASLDDDALKMAYLESIGKGPLKHHDDLVTIYLSLKDPELRRTQLAAFQSQIATPEQRARFLIEALKQGDDPETLESFLAQFPRWLASTDPSTRRFLKLLSHRIDANMYNHGPHALEAELLGLLRHPEVDDFKSHLVKAITAPYSFISAIKTITEPTQHVWRDAGLLTHDFKRWRFDASQLDGGLSLFEHFGFRPIWQREADAMDQALAQLLAEETGEAKPAANTSRPTDQIYGKGFLFKKDFNPDVPIDAGTLIEFRRGYLLASHPEHGTLVIRNSSRHFGRDLLDHPAYYDQNAVSEAQLQDFDPNRRETLDHILDKRLYHGAWATENMAFLLGEIDALRDHYGRWKFDVTAVQDNGNSAAHLSPGFDVLLHTLDRMLAQQEIEGLINPGFGPTPLSLAFSDPEYPAFLATQHRFDLDEANLAEISHYRQGHPPDTWPNFRHFLAHGVGQEKAELLIIQTPAPSKD